MHVLCKYSSKRVSLIKHEIINLIISDDVNQFNSKFLPKHTQYHFTYLSVSVDIIPTF